jgi:hypothetical protein
MRANISSAGSCLFLSDPSANEWICQTAAFHQANGFEGFAPIVLLGHSFADVSFIKISDPSH